MKRKKLWLLSRIAQLKVDLTSRPIKRDGWMWRRLDRAADEARR